MRRHRRQEQTMVNRFPTVSQRFPNGFPKPLSPRQNREGLMAKTRRTPVNLTDFKVKSLRPDPAGEYVQGDTQVPGFGVRVREHGTKTYTLMKRRPGIAA